MNFLAPFKTRTFENARERCVQHSRPDAKWHAVVALGTLLFAISAQDLSAQVGDNNPAGHSGIFNGQAGGCGYDPYTGNATRSITDVAVAGAVGEYPLALVRTANSRAPSTTEVFGFAGGWNHNYNWILEESEHSQTQNFHPASYTIEFPDGRVETFKQVNWDTSCYRARASNGDAGSSAGVRERFVQLDLNQNNQTYLYAYLVLPDGGKIEFKAVRYTNGNGRWWYKYHATAIYDPYGLKTQLVSSTTPSGVWRRVDWVIEPAGRSLHFLYTGTNSPQIASVTASDGRAVQYYYSYTMLDHVVYYSNPNWTARYQYTGSNIGLDLPPLLRTCDDPMYPGPMRRIAYEYKPGTLNDPRNPDGTTPVYGQIFRERYWDGVSQPGTGAIVSELTVGASPSNHNVRTEKRADNANQTRTFTYNGTGYLTWVTDFMGHSANQDYDDKKYVNSVTNFNRITTDYTNDPITGNVTQVKYPFTPEDTSGQGNTQPTVNYTYTNNYYLHTARDEAGNITTITRDGNNRSTQIDYPDGSYETFGYDAAHFYQLNSHRMITGGTETFIYDGRGLRQTYRNPDNATGNPTARYQYDDYDRVSDVTDVLGTSLGDVNHTTSFSYNLRGQSAVTTLPKDNGTRHTVTNWYNPDGTMSASQNELYQTTNYTYDDYRRLKSVTPPARGWGDSGTYITYVYYGANASDDPSDYKFADSNATFVVLPSGKRTASVYDDNRRRTSVTVGSGSEAAVTGYGYDNVGNLTSVTNPLNRNNVTTVYDKRNRPYSTSIGGQTTSVTFDTAGRKKTISRPNGQLITYESYDQMNRVLEQSATQNPTGTARTKSTYYAPGEGQPVGFLKEFVDPRLYGNPPSDRYTYTYDSMGRKTTATYPAEPVSGAHRMERWSYDTAGRLQQYTNRANVQQAFTYDALNRMTDFAWDDGLTPAVHFGYDAASRLTSINNVNANITRGYYNDNLLRSETEQILIAGGRSKIVTYTYDVDGNRGSTQYPDNYTFGYSYTGRNQLQSVNNWATYVYDIRGNLTTRTLNANNTHTDYLYDSHDRVTWVTQSLNGATRQFNYGYDDSHYSNNRLWTRRLGSSLGDVGEAFSYDRADQVIAVQHNVATPQNLQQPLGQNIYYDSNGNRTWYAPPGINKQYDPPSGVASNLNQYTSVIINGSQYNLAYRADANLAQYGYNNASYYYDAQNRLTSATVGGSTMYFDYDGLNRQVSRRTGVNGTRTFNVWDGWNLIEEYQAANQGATTAMYLYGASGLIAGTNNGQVNYHYQDGSGSTSHLADSTGHLLEWYRYDLQGAPFFYNPNDTQRSPNQSGFGVRHLFTGQQWYSQLGLYDLRNRFYSPDLGRFLQPDPIDFDGDSTNLYRYCGNNPVLYTDPSGTFATTIFGAITGGVAGAITGYSQGGWAGAGLGFVTGGVVGGVVGTVFPVGAPGVGSVVASAAVGAAASYLGQVVGNASGHIVQGQPPQARDFTNVNLGMIAGAGAGGALSPFLQTSGALLGTGSIARTVTSVVDGFVGGSLELLGGQLYVGDFPNETTSTGSGNVEMLDSHGNLIGTMPSVVVTAASINTRVAQTFGGVLYPYGFGNLSPNLNFAFGTAGTPNGAFHWTLNDSTNSPTLSNFGNIYNYNPVGAMEPGIGPGGCFVAGTPILMADGTEKPIEAIHAGEAVLAWNDGTRQTFQTKIIKPLHHEARAQTLFDIELEDGRRFTVNNNHPIYVIEDDEFVLTRELAARFASGQRITFQDNKGQPVGVANIRMRHQICAVYNLEVEGQGLNGHTYYASGVLVHNRGTNQWK